MRLALVSDIHGNITGMKAVLHTLSSLGTIDKLVVAGDVVTASSGSSDLLQLLLGHHAEIILGNAEAFLADPEGNIGSVPPRFHKYMNVWSEWLTKQLTENEWNTLIQSPLFRRYQFSNGKTIFVCHASPRSVWHRVCGSQVPMHVLREAYSECNDDIIAYGHNHNHHILKLDDKLLVNVASVGLRRDGMSCFTIIEEADENVAIRQYTVPYDAEEESRLNKESGAPVFEELTSS